ncbi:MAG: DUF3592 domain-containing protein [Gammaproteobacteria bacterium]|nr:DUF3592 domain-containing protein [Gammaproteobacteria bacterium]
METITAFSIFITLIIASFVVAAIYIYSNITKNLSESSATENITSDTDYWKAVKGEVTESKLDYKDSKSIFSKTKRLYRARFSYQYHAYDKKYTHSSLLLTWTPSKEIAAKYIERHPRGSEVVVRFHPDHPETSVMEVVTDK